MILGIDYKIIPFNPCGATQPDEGWEFAPDNLWVHLKKLNPCMFRSMHQEEKKSCKCMVDVIFCNQKFERVTRDICKQCG